MAKSWNHKVIKLLNSPEVRKDDSGLYYHHNCSAPHCLGKILFICIWDYVTGRQGRVSTAKRAYCEKHGRAFAQKHNISTENLPSVEYAEYFSYSIGSLDNTSAIGSVIS